MNTDKKHPNPGFLALGVPLPEGKAESVRQNLCLSVCICGFGVPGCTQPK